MNPEIARLLAGFPVVSTLPVQWGDQDAMGHVNNTIYFRWFESSRFAYGAECGLSELYESQRIGPILAAVSCNYRRQLIFPDTVHVGARITKIGRTSMVMEHRIVSETLQAIAAEGDSTIVMFDYRGQMPVPVSAALRNVLAALEGPESLLMQLNPPIV